LEIVIPNDGRKILPTNSFLSWRRVSNLNLLGSMTDELTNYSIAATQL
jgi:hypothetical protein